MNLDKLNPWNWFKHENDQQFQQAQVPVKRGDLDTAQQHPQVSSLFRLHRELDNMFDQVFNSFGYPESRSSFFNPRPVSDRSKDGEDTVSVFRPLIDVAGDKEKYEIRLDVPGFTEDDISIEVKNDVLQIKGKKETTRENKDKEYYCLERSYGTFLRTLSLPRDADANDIQAVLKDGVLSLDIPRQPGQEKEDTRKISISSSS